MSSKRPPSPSGIPVLQGGYRKSPTLSTTAAASQTERLRPLSPGSNIPVPKFGRARFNTPDNENRPYSVTLDDGQASTDHDTSHITSPSDQHSKTPTSDKERRRRSLPAIDQSISAEKRKENLMAKKANSRGKHEEEIHLDHESKPGVIYITENLIRKTSKEDDFRKIFQLKLTMSRELNRKIKYIENLDGLKNLRSLSLAHNMIEKIEKLDCLLGLQILDLSSNLISKIEGLDQLHQLQSLNLNDNRIEAIPAGTGKKLKCLQILGIARNQLSSLHELIKLRPLPDLTEISIGGNPMCSMSHCKQLAIFHLRSLERIDGNVVTVEDRAEADERFGQEEIHFFESELERLEKQLHETQAELSNSQEKGRRLHEVEQKMKLSNKELKDKVKSLEEHLNTNEHLLDSKTTELSKACEKQYRLEQELAFYKLDAKFDEFWTFPGYNEEYEDGEYVDGGESTYIGKARFKPNSFVHDQEFPTKQQVVNFIRYNAQRSPESIAKNKEIIQALEEALETDIGDKKEAIHHAEAKLNELRDELAKTEKRLEAASARLSQMPQVDGQPGFTNIDDRERTRKELIEKINQAKQLQQTVNELREKLAEAEEALKARENELQKLRDILLTTPETDPNYEKLQNRIAAKEEQLNQTENYVGDLQELLKEAEEDLAKRIEEIRTLEGKLKAGEKDAQGEIKEGLDGVAEKLSKHVETLKAQMEEQTGQYEALLEEHETLTEQLKQEKAKNDMLSKELDDNEQRAKLLEQDMKSAKGAEEKVLKLLEKLGEVEEALRAERVNARSLAEEHEKLRKQLHKKKRNVAVGNFDVWNDPVTKLEEKLRNSRKEAENLRDQLERMKHQQEAERKAFQDDLEKERRRLQDAVATARQAGDTKREATALAHELKALQVENESLKERLRGMEEELKDEREGTVLWEDVLKQKEALVSELESGEIGRQSPSGGRSSKGRKLQKLFNELRDKLNGMCEEFEDEKDKMLKNIDKLKAERDKLYGKVASAEKAIQKLQEELEEAQENLDSSRDRIKDTEDRLQKILSDRSNQTNALEDEMNDLQDRCADAERKADKAKQQLKSALAQLADTEKRLKLAENQARKDRRQEQEIEDLEAKLEEAKQKYQEAKTDLKNAQARLVAAEKQMRQAEDKAKQLDFELGTSEAQANQLARELPLLKNRLADEHRRYKEANAELQKAERRIRYLEAEIDRLRGQNNQDRKRMEELKRQVEEENSDLSSELTELANENLGLKRALKEQKLKLEQAEVDKARLRDTVGQLEDEIDTLRDSLMKLQKDTEEKLRAERDSHNEEVNDIFDDLDDIKKHIQNLKKNYEEDLGNANRRARDLKDSLQIAERKLQNAELHRGQLASLTEEIDNLRNMLRATEEEARKKDDLRRKYDTLMEQINALASQVEENERRRQTAGNIDAETLAKLNEDIALARGQVSSLRDALTAKENELSEARSAADPVIGVQRQEISSLLDRLRAKDAELQALRQTLNRLSQTSRNAPNIQYVVRDPHVNNATQQLPTARRSFPQKAVPQADTLPQDAIIVPPVSTLSQENVVLSPIRGNEETYVSQQQTPQIHHHHYGSGNKFPDPETLGSISATFGGNTHMHHHYGNYGSKSGGKKKKKKQKPGLAVTDEEFCNIQDHEDMGGEIKKLEDKLRETVHAKYDSPKERSKLQMELKEIESKVEDAVLRRSMLRRTLPRTLK